jgi:hypothetical protein
MSQHVTVMRKFSRLYCWARWASKARDAFFIDWAS